MSAVSLEEVGQRRRPKKQSERDKQIRPDRERQKKTVGGKENTVHFQRWPHNQTHEHCVLAQTSTSNVLEQRAKATITCSSLAKLTSTYKAFH